MRSTVLGSLLAAASTANALRREGGLVTTRVPGAFIFELEEGQDASSFYREVNAEGETRMDLDFELFKGVSVQLDDVEKAEEKAMRIAKTQPAVKNYWPVELYPMPDPEVEWVGLPSDGEKLESRAADEEDDHVTTFSPHVMTQVDKIRAKGVTGKGIKVAVVDTGIDYKHPALGGCFGEGCLVAVGRDFVGDAYNGRNTPVPDADPMDCGGHGTHVAGTVAAQLEGNVYGFTGAAPDVTLGAYKVFGCDGSTSTEVLIAAYMQAYEDGADIITASIGGPSGWTENPWAVAISRIVDAGVPCPVSAGNSGDQGQFYASSGSSGKGVTAVASYNNVESPTRLFVSHFSVDGGGTEDFGYTAATPAEWAGVELSLWAPDLDPATPNGGCDPYPSGTPDLSDKIVLVRRGTCTFVQKAQNAVAKGAKYIMIYNNAPGTGAFDVSTVPGILAGGMVTPEVGEGWIKLLSEDSEVVLSMIGPEDADITFVSPKNTVSGGTLSSYTSWGPTWGVDIKPQFGAPGGSILSTYPRAKGSYAVLSGTSMACPLVAGAIALVAEARGESRGTIDPVLMEDLLASHANPQFFHDGAAFYKFLAPVPQQGGGIIQVYDAAYANAVISPSGLSFNDTANFAKTRDFTIKNVGKEAITFEVGHVPTVSMYTLAADSIYPAPFPNQPVDSSASLSFSESKVTVPAGGSATVKVTAAAPSGLANNRLAVYSGFITLNGTDSSSLSIPYQGVVGSLVDATVLGPGDALVSRSDDEDLVGVPANTTFTLSKSGGSGIVYPAAAYYLALGSSQIRIDIVPLTTCPPDWTADFFGTKTIGQPLGFPRRYSPRGLDAANWDGRVTGGKWAPAGKYKFVIRALRINGDATKKEDWDVEETFPFRITYKE